MDGNKNKGMARGTRLEKLHADILVKLSGDDKKVEYHSAQHLIDINYAHIVMLLKQNIIDMNDAKRILKIFRNIEHDGAENVVPLDFKYGDLVVCLEQFVIEKTGVNCGGKINVGRSRNDINATVSKMVIREEVLNILESLYEFEKILLSMSEQNIETVMPGYTHHSRHAQPITFGYFLMGNFDVFYRDMQRFENLWTRLNLCPMGAAALATTSFDLDRELVADLLGFEDVHEHGYDAISSRDYLIEYLFIISEITCELGRMAENFLLWTTFEFDMVELADEYTSFSSIMPQKKNAVSLECIRALNPIIYGKLFNALSILKALPWCNGREITLLEKDHHDTAEKVINMIILFGGLLKSIKINKSRMYQLTEDGFSTATEIADMLVKEYDLPFRTAHEVVGLSIKKTLNNGKKAKNISSDLIEECINEYTGQKISIDSSLVEMALDPLNNVMVRKLRGGPAPSEVKRMIKNRIKKIEERKQFISSKRVLLENSNKKLNYMVDKII